MNTEHDQNIQSVDVSLKSLDSNIQCLDEKMQNLDGNMQNLDTKMQSYDDHIIKLSEMPNGSKVRVVGFSCDPALRGRLCSLGITPGTEIDLSQQCDSLCLKIKDCNLVLGEDVASGIMCERLRPCCKKRARKRFCFKNVFKS